VDLKPVSIREATLNDVSVVSEILKEAARWLEENGQSLWREEEFEPAKIGSAVSNGVFFVAEESGNAAGVMKFQLEDAEFWPDAPAGEAAYIHKLAIRRKYAGTGLSHSMIGWAIERTKSLRRGYLRLDCEAARPRLRAFYESSGFKHRDDRQVGPYFVSRYEMRLD
jgi:GNAT superfamily N-acetyltransferase